MSRSARCWCGNTGLKRFSTEYLRCARCETLVLEHMPAADKLLVVDDQNDFYGRQYYQSYLVEQFGFPTLAERTRGDLAERCVHWLETLLKYKLPPASVLELGSAHGAFVALMRWAGFEARGLELSPWLVEFAKNTFDVPMLVGPIEQQNIAPQSLDALVAMDVLEHLPDPVATVRQCVAAIGARGILLFQTPRYREGKSFEEMVAENDPFLVQLKSDQHLYLFSRQAITEFLHRLGIKQVCFETAIFSSYDMFVVGSPSPLCVTGEDERQAALEKAPSRRLARAVLDINSRLRKLTERYETAEADRSERLAALQKTDAALRRLEQEGERRLAGMRELTQIVAARDARIAGLEGVASERLAALQKTDAALRQLEQEGERRLAGMQELTQIVAARDARIAELEGVASERLAGMQAAAAALRQLEQEGERRLGGMQELTQMVAARDAHIAELERRATEMRQRAQDLTERVIAFERESLLNFLLRRIRNVFGRGGLSS